MLRCRCHNLNAARQDFGTAHIEARVAVRRGAKSRAQIRTNRPRGQSRTDGPSRECHTM